MWVLGIPSQILVFSQQALYPLSHLTGPTRAMSVLDRKISQKRQEDYLRLDGEDLFEKTETWRNFSSPEKNAI